MSTRDRDGLLVRPPAMQTCPGCNPSIMTGSSPQLRKRLNYFPRRRVFFCWFGESFYVSFIHVYFFSIRNNSIDPCCCYIIGLRWPSQTRPLYQFLLIHQPEVCTLQFVHADLHLQCERVQLFFLLLFLYIFLPFYFYIHLFFWPGDEAKKMVQSRSISTADYYR